MVYITGDTHGHDLISVHVFCDAHPELTKDDYLIIAGDFGGIWSKETLEKNLDVFSELPMTVLFVDGNHENFDLLEAYPEEIWKGGRVHRIRPDIIHLMRGQVFRLDGMSVFAFGGATSLDRAFRTEGISWWSREVPSFAELDEGVANLARCGNKVDYIVTHSCGERALMYLMQRGLVGQRAVYPENRILSNFEDAVSFRHWYFGHFHVDAGLSDKYTALLHAVKRIEP